MVGFGCTYGNLLHRPTTCPHYGSIMIGIYVDRSYGLPSPSARGDSLGVSITISSVHIKVWHGTIYAFAG